MIYNIFNKVPKIFFKKIKGQKLYFIFTGLINTLITNIVLQFLLILEVFPTSFSTLISQITNMTIGYYLYSTKVFNIRNILTKHFIYKYAILMLVLWTTNSFAIIKLINIGFSKSSAALLLIPLLALISFTVQKFWVFKN